MSLLAESAHGPNRDGLFALWLVVRVAEGGLPGTGLADSAQKRRAANLRRRLSSLTVPRPLRRALTAALRRLEDADPGSVVVVLHELIAPTREELGPEPAEALALAARSARLSLGTR